MHAQRNPLDVTHRQAPAAGPDGTPSRPRFSPLCDCRFVVEKRHAVGENGVRATARRMDGSGGGEAGLGGSLLALIAGFLGGHVLGTLLARSGLFSRRKGPRGGV